EFQDTDPVQWKIFKRLFVEGADEHRLFVVGDPKQAIFRFRGADLYAYLQASKELTERYQAKSYPLPVNWRTWPDLLEALNDVFEKSGWFSETGIDFRRVTSPDADKRRHQLIADRSKRPALSAVDLTGHDALVPARRQYARFIAAEILRLLGQIEAKPALEIRQK